MILKRFSVFYILFILCVGASCVYGQASLQRGVRISNANGNIVSIGTGGTTLTYSLTLPLASNPSLTTASLLFGSGTGNLGWTDATGAVDGSILVLQNSGGNLTPVWTDPLSLNYWTLSGNPIASAWNGTAGNFLGTTTTQPLVLATTNTTTPQPIEFYTNNVEKMRLSPAGNLGIGQTNPSQLLEVGNGNILLSNSGTAGELQFQGTGTGLTTLQAGAQGATTINYTLPLSLPPIGGYVLASSTTGVMSWIDPSSLSTTDWHLLGNFGTTAWNGAAGNFLGTTDAQPAVIATTSTATPQPIEFYTNTTEKMRISANGNIGINQTNPAQLVDVSNGNFLLSNTGTADQLQFQGTSTGLTTFQAGAQGATNINYTLPTAAAAANGYVLSSTTGGVMSWTDPTTLPSNDWHLIGNAGTAAWNGSAGNFLGTTDAQPTVIATTNTATPQPIEFYTNTTEKMRLSANGNLGLNQTNPSQLFELSNGNLYLSNTGSTDQLQFQGTSTGITTFQAGAQGATNINYTLPTAAAAANGYVLSSTTGGVMSWTDPSTLPTNDWHLIGNAGTTAWNGTTGNFLGTTDVQPTVIATTNTTTPQPIEFYTNSTEKMRISANGNIGINQTNPAQLVDVSNGNFLLSNTGTADQLQFQGTSTGLTTFQAGAQGATNINYTLPTAAAAANGYVLSSTTGGVMSWTDPSTLPTNDWHLIGNAGTAAWNGATGNFLGTTDAQPLVVATTNTTTPEPIEFYTNNAEKMRLSATGNLGLNQTNPSQLLELSNGNLYLSNTGSADQLQFQGTSTGLTTFQAGAQGATNINYTLPITAASADGYVLSSTTGGTMSWIDPTQFSSNDWHILGNTGTTAWNGATGNFLGTTDVQPTVIATTNTATPQPIEFYTNTTEKMRISATGNIGINQTNPAQLVDVSNGNFLLSNSGTADQLQFQGTSSGITTFQAGAQGATNINYTLPISSAAADGYVLSSTTGGILSWLDPTTIQTNDWHLLGNSGTTAWNGSTGNFLGTTDAQPLVVATTNTTTPEPIEFFTNNAEKMRLSATGNLGLNQTNPSQLLELSNGNLYLSNTGSADQLQFQGTSTGITTFQAGAQGATNINYTLPTAAAAADGYVLSSTTGGAMSWIDPTTIPTNDWHITGNSGTSAWNGSTGNIIGTLDAQDFVIGTGATAATREKVRITQAGDLQLSQPGTQLSFLGTAAGVSTFQAGAQGATSINYTLPTAAPSANSLLYSSGGAINNLNWSNTGTNGQILTINGGIVSWEDANSLTGFVLYDVSTPQNPSITRTNNLFNIAYAAGANDADAAGAVITSTAGATNRSSTALSLNSTASGTGISTGLSVTASGGASQTAIAATGNINLLSAGGVASSLSFQNPAASFATTFTAGAQGANIDYTLPTAAAAVNGYVLSSTTGGVLSWIDPTTLASTDWHILGNAGTTAWNGATGNFLGTTDVQPTVIATTNTATPQPIEFYTNTTEKMRISANGNIGINQTNPAQLVDVSNGNFLLSNTGTADQLQFQGTSTGLTTFQAGAQGATNINYTLPTAAAAANGYVLSSTTGGVMSWTDPSTLPTNDWHLIGNAGTAAWNGATGNFLGTTDAQPLVVATTNTTTPEPIEFYTNNAEKMRLSATGNLGLNQTNPSQLFELSNGNLYLSNTGSADQLQFQGTSTGITTFQAGAQGATNINYTLPITAAAANGYVLSSTTGGVLSWIDPTTLANTDWHILGNAGTTAWNGATGNFLGTTDVQPTVIATTNTATPQPIEFYTNTTEKMRISANGNIGINQTNPAQLVDVSNGNFLLSNTGTADQLQFQGTSTGLTTFQAGAQGATNINYTLPTAAAAANGYVLSSTTGGVMSWTDPSTLPTNDWHLIGNAGTAAWNGATGNFLGTTDAQPLVVATTNTTTPEPIEFYTNNAEKMRLSATGNLGLNQTNPSQLFELSNGNLYLSNTGSADQLQFQGTSTGITTFQAGAQGATNINYTLPITAAAANGYVLSSTTGGVLSWIDPTTLANTDWHILGNAGTTAWNGATGNFLGTTDVQPTVIATTNTATPQPIEFYTNTTEKMRLSATGNLGINQTNPSQMLEVKSGNVLLSNAGTADQLQFQGTGTGLTTFQAGAQGATNINYTLPTAAAAANGYVLSSTTGGAMSWIDPTTIPTNDWHITGNSGTTAWNGAAGNIIGTLDAQDFVIGTGATAATREKVRITQAGNLQLSQPGTQLSFLGTSTGVSTFQAGAQGATNLNYTLPIAAPSANSLLYSSGGAVNNLNWSNTGTNGQILTITGGAPSWQNANTLTGFVLYDVTTPQNPAVTRTDNLFNVAYAAGANDANAAGAVITAAGGATNRSATGLTVTSTATGTGASTALSATASGGASQTALAATGNINILSAGGTANSLSLQNPAGTFASSFLSGAQAANFAYTLPTSAPSANSLLYSSGGAVNNLNWSNTGTNGQILTITGGAPSWQNANTLTGFVLYDVTTPQNPAVTRTDNLFNVAYAGGANDANAAGAVITAAGGATNRSATGLTVTSTATGTGTSTGLAVTASGGATQNAIAATGNVNLLSSGGTASKLSFQNPAGTFSTTFIAGAQAANINYTLPTAAAAVNGYILSSTTAGVLSWLDPTTIPTNDWHLLGNAGTSAWNGATGNFLGTTDAQPAVIATTFTTTPQPIEFYTNTTEKMRISATGNVGINQTNPSQLLDVKNGNVLLSNSGSADQLQFQGTSTGVSTFQAGAQGATNLNYTLPTSAPSANSLLYSSGGAVNNLNWSNTGTNGQILTITGGAPSWQNANTLTGFVLYDVTTPQNPAATRTDNLFNVAYAAGANDANAAGAVITAAGGATNRSATGLTVTSTATGTGTSTGLAVTASGGVTQNAIAATGNVNLLSSGGTASKLSFQNPAGTFSTTFIAGAQAASFNYTLPTAAPSANSLLYSSGGAVNNLNWSNTGTNGQILTITGGAPSWQNVSTLTGFVLYDVTTPQNPAATRTDNLFNVAYAGGANDANAAGAVITAAGGATNRSATGLTVTSTATGTGTSTGLAVTASGGATQNAIAATGNVNLLSSGGTASKLSFQNPAGTFSTTFIAGAQAANINYTLPTAAAAVNGYILSSTTAGVLSWLDPTTIATNDWHLTGNSGTTAWNGAAGNIIGTLDAQDFVIGTGATAATREKVRITQAGNLQLSQPGTQLSFLGTSTGVSTFQAGAQGATNLNYTLPIAAPSANSLLYSSGGAVNNLNWSNTGTNGQILTITGGAPSWQNVSTLTGFVLYDVTTPQNPAATRTDNLFNVAYAAGANDANAAGAVITAAGGATNRSATGLTVTSTATGTGAATALSATATGGASQTALAATGNINILSAGGVANSLSLQNPAGTFASSFLSGAQAANLSYTLPITAPVASSLLYSAGGASSALSWTNTGTNGQVLTISGGVPSWQNAAAGGGTFVNYNTPSVQNTAVITSANYLYNVAYAASATTNNALGAVISSVSGTSGNTNANGLSISATANGTGISTGLIVSAGGGGTNYAATFNGGNVGVGNAAPNTDVDISGDLATREYNYATSMSGTKNNVSFDGLNPANQMSFVRIASASGPFTITGIAGGQNGKFLTVYNGTNQSMTIANQNASSTAANRIITGTQVNIPVPTGGSADFIYSATESRWVVHATSGVSGWLYTGNSGLTDGVNNFHGTLDNTPIRFVTGSTNAPSTKMVLDINGNLLFGANSGNANFTQGSGRVAFGDSVTTTRLASVPTYVNRVFNMIDPNAVVRIWRFNSNSGGTDPAIELVGGTNDNQGNAANHWWDIYATGTPGVAGSGTGGQGEHMSFRRRTGAHDSEYLAVFAGGNVGIGNNNINPVETPDHRLVVRQFDGATNSISDLVSIFHSTSAANGLTAGFGSGLVFKADDSTTGVTPIIRNQEMAEIAGVWTNALNANRTGALAFSTVNNAGGETEAMRILGNGNVGIGTTTPQVSLDITGALATESTNKSLSNGNNNNVSNLGNVSFARITGPTSAFTITGIAGGSNGQILRLINTTSQDMTLSNLSASSSAGNRIYSSTGSDLTLSGQNASVELIYDATNSQWVITNTNANASTGPIGTIQYMTKAADQSVTNSTVLTNDNDISFNANSSETWEIIGELHADNTNTGPNIKIAFTSPAGSTMKIYYNAVEDGGVTGGASVLTASGVSKTVTIVGGTSTYIQVHGIVRNGGTGGVIQLKWAQATANAASTKLRQDSFIKATRVN